MSALQEKVIGLLKQDYSPEQIVGYAKKDHFFCVSHERIYQFIWQDKKKGGEMYKHLRTQGKRYRKRGAAKDKRGMIPDRIFIDQRPDIINNRERMGDVKVDLVIGKNHKFPLLTILERKTGYAFVHKVNSKSASDITKAIIAILSPYKKYIHSITSDNGKEFAGHKQIAKALEIDYYFAHPYHSWERGCNENYNKLLRQYFPKKTDFTTLDKDTIEVVQQKINIRPRKRFNLANPTFLFNQNVAFIT